LLIYDGECRFCQAQVARMRRWAGAQLVPLPLQKPGLLEALGISQEEAMAAMQLVTQDGRIYAGVEAVTQALRHRPILGRLLRLYYVPGCRHLADLGYRLVARYRYRLMGRAIARGECDGGSCALHLEPK
jgi:predicted DCC family thiol-disulfide oxidoreductase YuxK